MRTEDKGQKTEALKIIGCVRILMLAMNIHKAMSLPSSRILAESYTRKSEKLDLRLALRLGFCLLSAVFVVWLLF